MLDEEFLDKPWNEYHIGLFDPNFDSNVPMHKIQELLAEVDSFTRRDVIDKVCKREASLKPMQPGLVSWKTLALDALLELQCDIFKKQGHILDSNLFRTNARIQTDCNTFRRAVNSIYIASDYRWEDTLKDPYFDQPWRKYSIALFDPNNSISAFKQEKPPKATHIQG